MAKKPKKPPTTEERLRRLDEGIKRIDGWMENQDEQLINLRDERKKDRDVFKNIDEMTNEAKKEITTFTFELISMIIGFLSLLLAIVVLWINRTEINTQMEYILLALGIAFTGFFIFFVLSWRKKNFPKVEGMTYDNIILHIESNNSNMVDYIDSKISDVGDVINSKNSDMSGYIKDEISKYCEYTDEKIGEVAEFIKKNKK